MMARLLDLIEGARAQTVAVIGDLIADEFIYGQLSRVSREAPVLILKYDSTTVLPGGAGNAATNVAALGAQARLVGVVGRAEIDRRLVRSLPRGVDRSGLVRPPGYRGAGQDSNPGGWSPLGAAADRTHRPGPDVAGGCPTGWGVRPLCAASPRRM